MADVVARNAWDDMSPAEIDALIASEAIARKRRETAMWEARNATPAPALADVVSTFGDDPLAEQYAALSDAERYLVALLAGDYPIMLAGRRFDAVPQAWRNRAQIELLASGELTREQVMAACEQRSAWVRENHHNSYREREGRAMDRAFAERLVREEATNIVLGGGSGLRALAS